MKRVAQTLALLAASWILLAEPASASSGQINHAYANQDWTRGSFAMSVTWTDCGSGPCSWLPVATVQPTLPSYSCHGDEALDSDPNTRNVWSGGNQSANGTVATDISDVPILSGVQGQRLCVSVIEQRQIRDPVCVAQAPVFGMDPNDCPFINQIVYHVLATKLLTLQPGTAAQAGGDALTKSTARKSARRALKRKFGRRYKRGKRKRLNCAKKSETKFKCRVKWVYDNDKYKGKVVVKMTGSGYVRVTVKVPRP